MKQDFKKLRVSGETISLVFSFLVILFVTLVIFEISLFWVLVALVFQLIYVLATQRQLIGNSLVVNDKQFQDIDSIVRENAGQFGIKPPNVFVSQDPYINAFTIGFMRPYSIVLTSALVESLTRDELDYVIGHEMGHVKFGHAKWLSFISPIGQGIPFISWLYGGWQRKAEYSADRAGLVLTGKIKPALTSIVKMSVGMKLAKLVDVDEIIKQIGEGRTGFMSKVGELMLTHPYSTNRIRALVEFCYFSGHCETPRFTS